jgi:hypothetical protein
MPTRRRISTNPEVYLELDDENQLSISCLPDPKYKLSLSKLSARPNVDLN